MYNNRFFIAVIVSALVAFFGGWLVFGMLFSNYYIANTNDTAEVLVKDPPLIWAILIANIAWACLITYILKKAGTIGFLPALATSSWISFLMMLVFDISIYAFWNIYNLGFLVVDIIISTIFWGLIGGVAGAILGSRKTVVVQ